MNDENWKKFEKSGKIEDYLKYVNSTREGISFGGSSDSLHCGGFSNKVSERGGK